MSRGEYEEEREREEDARRERIRIEVYRAASLIYARHMETMIWSAAISEAIQLWDAMNDVAKDKRPY